VAEVRRFDVCYRDDEVQATVRQLEAALAAGDVLAPPEPKYVA
jgi:hypothetical protein